MKGIVFNLLEEAVQQSYGPQMWDDILDDSGLNGAYTSLGNYPDSDLLALVGAASARLNMPAEAIVRWMGRSSIPLLVHRYPHFFASHQSTRPFLMSLNDIIHPEVRKIYEGADAPSFDFSGSTADVLIMAYQSRRKLCAFAEGLIEGSAHYYQQKVALEQIECAHRGDQRCVFRIQLTS